MHNTGETASEESAGKIVPNLSIELLMKSGVIEPH